jgi:hypothetical protein
MDLIYSLNLCVTIFLLDSVYHIINIPDLSPVIKYCPLGETLIEVTAT